MRVSSLVGLLLLWALRLASAQMGGGDPGMGGMGGMGSGRRQRDKEPVYSKADVAGIACDVCEIVVSEVHLAVEAARLLAPSVLTSARPGAPKVQKSTFSETEVNVILNDVCNRRKDVGEWVWFVDIVESAKPASGGRIWRPLTKKEKESKKNFLLLEQWARDGDIRKWDQESASLKRSCDYLLSDDIEDIDDLAVALWRGISKDDAKKLACRTLTPRCTGMRKAVTKRKDLEFEPQEKSMLGTERMMETMKEQGMPMVMQSRQDMMDELTEQLMSDGMTEKEAAEFMEMTTASASSEPGEISDEAEAPDL